MEEHAGQTEQGYPPRGGYGDGGGAEWDRGANLKEYYARRDEQEAQAVLEPAMCYKAAFKMIQILLSSVISAIAGTVNVAPLF